MNNAFPYLVVGAVLWTFGCLAFLSWRHRVHGLRFPDHRNVNVLFNECWTSGASRKSIITRLFGANNCLHVTVTNDELWVAAHFPFNAMAEQFDLEHRVRRDAITYVEQNGRKVHVTFTLEKGDKRTIVLQLRNANRFYEMLQGGLY